MFLDPLLGPILGLQPLWAIVLVSFVITLIATLVYKWTTDQHLMKTLKEDMKKFQEEMRQFKEDPHKVLEVQKRAMETNMKYFMHSMKPMIVTLIPFLLIFTWLSAHFAYEPIYPNQVFASTAVFEKGTTGNITIIAPEGIEVLSKKVQKIENDGALWEMKGEAGEYLIEYEFGNKKYKQELLITNNQEYKNPIQKIENSKLKILQLNNQKIKPLNLFGWRIGWFGTYFLFSVIFNMTLRKAFKLH